MAKSALVYLAVSLDRHGALAAKSGLQVVHEQDEGVATGLHTKENKEPEDALVEEATFLGTCARGAHPVESMREDCCIARGHLPNHSDQSVEGREKELVDQVSPGKQNLV